MEAAVKNYLDEFKNLMVELSGQEIHENASYNEPLLQEDHPIGYNQFNELLLLHGFNKISATFFQYLVNGKTDEDPVAFITVELLRERIVEAHKLFLLVFGNIRFGYRVLSENSATSSDNLDSWVAGLAPIEDTAFKNRKDQLINLELISKHETYYLGYIVQKEIRARLDANPNDHEAKEMNKKKDQIVASGVHNHNAYLASDYMDIYVATSMRTKQEFLFTGNVIEEVFHNSDLKRMKIRWFDPTQAYCSDRIDKGLSEALMLKRATCTLYLAQETDTLGKDSELAVTLAQGKPVIAFVPYGDKHYVDKLIESYKVLEKASEDEAILKLLSSYRTTAAWDDKDVRKWIDGDRTPTICAKVLSMLYEAVEQRYETRARTLSDVHPLGIQAQIETGLAIGVLVVRTYEECAKLLKSVILRQLKFDLEIEEGHCLLRETISKSVYRVMTKDRILSNAFWNFYIN